MNFIYIESTVISYYTGRPNRDLIVAAHQELTREWWENILPKCSPFISQFVLDEISRGNQEAVNKRIKAVENDRNLLFLLLGVIFIIWDKYPSE